MSRGLIAFNFCFFVDAFSPNLSVANRLSEACEDASNDEVSLLQSLVTSDAAPWRTAIPNSGNLHVKLNMQTTIVKPDMVGDLPAFLAAIKACYLLFICSIVVFMVCQRHYPKIYGYRIANNWKGGEAKSGGADEENDPKQFKDDRQLVRKWWTWASLSLSVKSEDIERTSGLDAAMLIRFSELAIELMLVFGLPFCIIGCPVYAFLGGGFAKQDSLGWLGIGNVVWNNTQLTGGLMLKEDEAKLVDAQWIFWVVAVMVWVVLLWTQHRLFGLQREFIHRRMDWLTRLNKPRSTTLLVQGIPADKRNDKAFGQFFSEEFGIQIQHAFVVKNLSRTLLARKLQELDVIEQELIEAKFALEKGDGASQILAVAEVKELKMELEEIRRQIATEQDDINQQLQDHVDREKLYTHSGFVTFVNRSDCERILHLKMSENENEWIFETPPDPSDVRYHDFEAGDDKASINKLLGYAATAGLFLAFIPLVLGISNVSLMIKHFPAAKGMIVATGMKSTVDGLLATMGLTIMMAMLPSCLMWIFEVFYTLKANRWAQLRLQEYYFWFLVNFVLLVTVIGISLERTMGEFSHSPYSAAELLAASMPTITHFYLKYAALQTVTHGISLTRYMTLMKFVGFKNICDVDRARELSEPEDQDYYGMGSRSARFTVVLVIGLVFGTICPLMNIFVLLHFFACRLIYGYLIPFAEMRKVDQGGQHWRMQMIHTHYGLLIYLVMMTGILIQRAESKGPGVISAVGFVWWCAAHRKFIKILRWESLPYTKLFDLEVAKELENSPGSIFIGDMYCQKELELFAVDA